MEPNLENSNITIPNLPQEDVEPKPKPVLTRKRNNGAMDVIRLALFMLRGRSKKKSVIPVDDKSTSIWRKIVGSIRPLHLQSNQSPPLFSQSNSQKFDQPVILLPSSPPQSIGGGSVLTDFPAEEPFSPSPMSPANSCYASAIGLNELVQSDENSRYAASAIGLNELVQSDEDIRYASAIGLNELVQSDEDSRYASAIGLNKLVQSDEENDRNDLIIEECNENGDDKIDDKADEFIAQFYQQMRLQRLNNVDRRYQERSQRSLGL
ncbi:hypothetical protein MtrunA17_Chr7g0269821 [Medicago truncatula]|uniref:DUF761 domain protein n=1 Tax=Medicago truncatula TaxID=3880 RepID=G7KSR6_MEDTR|nr:uncharacterized protein LOC11432031 [Medicago truncatula]AES82167.1 DUF761 domain protein [Medicago truncatula]RHN49003.1 hypothetical protein MtrunA17_Chr7g0269821 [Medicago truncatula]